MRPPASADDAAGGVYLVRADPECGVLSQVCMTESTPEIEQTLRAVHHGTLFVDASRIAIEMGSVRVANVILLGAMSLSLGFSLEAYDAALHGSVPKKAIDLNLQAFRCGQEIAAAAADTRA